MEEIFLKFFLQWRLKIKVLTLLMCGFAMSMQRLLRRLMPAIFKLKLLCKKLMTMFNKSTSMKWTTLWWLLTAMSQPKLPFKWRNALNLRNNSMESTNKLRSMLSHLAKARTRRWWKNLRNFKHTAKPSRLTRRVWSASDAHRSSKRNGEVRRLSRPSVQLNTKKWWKKLQTCNNSVLQ